MRTVAIIQARMGSTRLPGKILRELGSSTVLEQVVTRLQRCETLDDIVVATTNHADDDVVVDAARRYGTHWFRGSEHDVLTRYAGAARATRADVIVRITSDCPLIDPSTVDSVVRQLQNHPCDYASNTKQRTYPRGLDVEALHTDALMRTHRLATSAVAREHVTAFIHQRPDLFVVRQLSAKQDDSDLRWTVDTAEDLKMVRMLYSQLALVNSHIGYRDIVDYVRARPELSQINSHIMQTQLPLAS